MIDILYQDSYFIAVNKPNGLLVHRSNIAKEETEFVLQKLRDQIGAHLFPVHRLDRPTSGVLLFAFDKVTAQNLSQSLISGEIKKEYIALIRGWMKESILLNHPVKNDRGNLKEAITQFKPLHFFTLHHPIGAYETARYSLVSCFPQSGRWHQIRQHLAHLRHYIINDRVHGDGKHNKLFKEVVKIESFFLHAASLTLTHPITLQKMVIEAPFPPHWDQFHKFSLIERH